MGRGLETRDLTIYFIKCSETGRIKIGRTRDVRARLEALQTATASPLRLVASFEGPKRAEGLLHQRFHHLLAGGEWFRPGEELLAFIRGEGWTQLGFVEQTKEVVVEPYRDTGEHSQRVKAARLAAHMSQSEAARRMPGNVTMQYWSNVETGIKKPSLEWLWYAAKALGINPHTLDERLASKRWPKPETQGEPE